MCTVTERKLILHRYSSGDVYSGSWSKGQRVGFGKLEEVSHKSSVYLGEWVGDKKKGYGIYDDKMKYVRTYMYVIIVVSAK